MGNLSTASTSADIANRPGVDGNSPQINNVVFTPTTGTLKVGDTATATIYAKNAETGLASGTTMTINTIDVRGTFIDNDDGTYTVTYTVGEGHNDVDDDSEDLAINLTIQDAVGNVSAASTSADIANRPGVDANTPSTPGNLSFFDHTSTSITIELGATTTEANFKEYRIYYKEGASGVSEANNLHSSSTDENLGDILFKDAATTTITGLATGTQYVFNIWAYDWAGNKASATVELATATNYAPANASSLAQFRHDGATAILNSGWTNEDNIKLQAQVTDPDDNEIFTLYYEAATSTDAFSGDISSPCSASETWENCTNKVWATTSLIGDYSATPFTGWVNPSGLYDSSAGYKWQVKACDDHDNCSAWVDAGTDPNFKVDQTEPTDPGYLEEDSKTSISVTLTLGTTTTETNFREYIIYYKANTPGVTEDDLEHSSSTDINLSDQNYLGAATTTIEDLSAGTLYYFNIWAYDYAGNKASATEMSVTTNLAAQPPTGLISTAIQKKDGSGAVDIAILVDDPDNDDTLRVQIEYASDCSFSPSLDPTIDPSAVSDTHGSAPDIDNAHTYQVGTTSAWIITSPGANTVNFDWLSKSDEVGTAGTYCLRLTANDGQFSQNPLATKTVYIDNINPTQPGVLSLYEKTTNSLILNYGATTTETNFKEYKIFYKIQDGIDPNESDNVLASSTDNNLSNILFFNEATTTIDNLADGTTYSIAIWAYDEYGNIASSSAINETTNYLPVSPASLDQFKLDGATAITNGSWATENGATLEAGATDADTSEVITLYFELLTDIEDFTTATSVPFNACASTTLYGDCLSKFWAASSSLGDYSVVPFTGTVQPTDISPSDSGYKWQVLACDDDNVCSNHWTRFNASTPNFKVDYTEPSAPGALEVISYTSTSTTLAFGASTTDDNFKEYIVYYQQGTDRITEDDLVFSSSTDINLAAQDFNEVATTKIDGLSPGLIYSFDIWAYDQAGNMASSTFAVATTTNNLPTGIFTATSTRRDGNGAVDLTIAIADVNGDKSRAKIEYEAGSSCAFISATKATLDETDSNTTCTEGDAKVENDNTYQIGNASGWILTSAGANTINFDWLSEVDEVNEEGTYCLRLTTNDLIENQAIPATTTVYIDNIEPSAPGNLSLNAKASTTITLGFGATTTETNFKEYRIYWQPGVADVDENDNLFGSSSDENLADIDFNDEATTTISGLNPNSWYSFKIYAYDKYGNKSNSGYVSFQTNAPPSQENNYFNPTAQRTDGSGIVDISIEVYDVNGDLCQAKIEYEMGENCKFTSPVKPSLDETDENVTADHGDPGLENDNEYQVGYNGAYIITTSGSNSVHFDWDALADLGATSTTYCLRLTVNDGMDDQATPATTTVIIDTLAPTLPGDLTDIEVGFFSATLGYGASSTDDHFSEYKIFYNLDSTRVTEEDSAWDQADDNNLSSSFYGSATTTTITSLQQSTDYTFNIFVYDSYGNIASATSELATSTIFVPSATWREDEDTPDPVAPTVYLSKGEPIRLRIAVANSGDWNTSDYHYRLEYGIKNGSCAAVPVWTAVSTIANSEHFIMTDSDYFNHGASTTIGKLTDDGHGFTNGYMVENPYNSSGRQDLISNQYTEIEYAFAATATSTAGETYCFRATNNGAAIELYNQYPELTIAPPPDGSFNTAEQKPDGSHTVDISIEVSDAAGELSRAKLEYVLGADCDFATSADPTLDEASENITADWGNPAIDNNALYQIGTATNMIITQYGANTVEFDWDTSADLSEADNTYCLRLTVNNNYDDQTDPATTTIDIDQVAPSEPGNLTQVNKTLNSATLGFGTTSEDSHFKEYRIFYREAASGVTESDTLWGSSSDESLGHFDFAGEASTTIKNLEANKQYVFNIWAYDEYRNKTKAAEEIVIKTVPSISGVVYINEGLTPLLTGPIVSIVVDGNLEESEAASTDNGIYTFTDIETPATGTPMVIYLDGALEKGAIYVRYGGSGQITDFHIYQDRIIVRHDDNGPITLADLDSYDSDEDPYIQCTVTGDVLSLASGQELYVWPGNDFIAGSGDINLTDIKIEGSFTAVGDQTIYVAGNWDASGGVFTAAMSMVEFNSSGGNHNIITNNQPFYSINFNGSGGEWTFVGTTTVNATTTISDGTLNHGGDNNFDTRSLVIANGAEFIKATGTGLLIFEGDGQVGYIEDNNPTPTNLGNVQIGYSPAVTKLNADFAAESLTVNAGDSFDTRGFEVDIVNFITVYGTYDCTDDKEGDGTITTLGTDWTVDSGATFTADTSTTTFDGAANSSINTGGIGAGHSFNHLTLAKAAIATTTINYYDMRVSGDIIIGANSILDASSTNYDIYAGGSWENSGQFIARQATTTFEAAAGENTVDAGDSAFYNIIFNNGAGGWNIIADATSTNNWQLKSIAGFSVNAGVIVAVQGEYMITDAVPGNTTWSAGAVLGLNSGTAYNIGSKTQTAEDYAVLRIGADTDIELWNSSSTVYEVNSTGSLYSMDHGNVNGELYIWGDYRITAGTAYWTYADDFDGTPGANRQVRVYLADQASTTVAGGTLNITGISTASTTITNQGAGTYGLSIISGTLDADYFSISGISSLGLELSGQPTVDIDYGDFLLETNNGSMITISSSVISANPYATSTGCQFATSTGISAGNNISLSGIPTLAWQIEGHYGNYAGEAYDSDPGDPRGYVVWDDSPDYVPKSESWQWFHDQENETPLSPAAAATTSPSVDSKAKLKLRLTISETGGLDGADVKMRLQYSTSTAFTEGVNYVGEIGSTTATWTYADGGGNDNDLIVNRLLIDSIASGTHNESGISDSIYTHASNTAAEWEFTLYNNSAATGTVYYFRAAGSFYRIFETLTEFVVTNEKRTYPSVIVTAGSLSLQVSGIAQDTLIEETITTDFTTTATSVPFGTLSYGVEKEGAQRFTITTNAECGYQLLTWQRQNLANSTGADIDPITASNDNPAGWPDDPYPGGFGYHTSDDTLSNIGLGPSRFSAPNTYAYFETNMREISYSSIPVENETTDLVYKIEVTNMQEAGDYETEIVYILVPTF